MIGRCEDPKCPCYNQKYADRGYGYPVCPSQKWFSERFPGSENKPLAAEYQEWKIEFRGKYDDPSVLSRSAEISIEYADLYDTEGEDAGVLAVFAETYQDGWDTKWTGNAEVCFRTSDGEDFDMIAVLSAGLVLPDDVCDEQDEHNRSMAKALIKTHLDNARDIEIKSRQER